jgi:hypothetical protein
MEGGTALKRLVAGLLFTLGMDASLPAMQTGTVR